MDILIFPAIIATVASMVLLAGYVLSPLLRARNVTRVTALPRIYLIDLVSLIVLLQIALAFGTASMLWVAVPAIVGILYLWWRGAGALSFLGIHDSPRRATFLLFVMPVAILGAIIAPCAALVLILCLIGASNGERGPTPSPLLPAAAVLGIASPLFPLARLLTGWIVAKTAAAPPPPNVSPDREALDPPNRRDAEERIG